MRRRLIPAIATALLLATASLAGAAAAQDETTLVYDGDRVTIENGPAATIEGATDLDAGTRLVVRVTSADTSAPFFKTIETTVEEGGRFTATGDFSDVAAGVNTTVEVRRDGEVLAKADGEIVPCESDCTPTESESDAPSSPTAMDEFGLNGQVVQVEAGDVARVPVSLGDADAATLSIGSDDLNYRTNATVRDGNGDGLVIVTVDTGAAGVDGQTLSTADDADELTVTAAEPDLDEPIDPASYDLALFRGEAGDGSPDDLGAMVLAESSSETATPGDDPSTADGESTETTAALDDATPAGDGGVDLGGVGALATGGLLAVGAVALLFGVTRY
ncbi:BGTF surface domain-containing protein [Halomicrobium salinisoli]|uniref:BGTF surface domain-containing protein n=1 Tax=Halomicrobium salinisoli TaxID=2878391 RepID=UPI001CEFD91A|nr:BGTF surface domain-containing protein [Halomicrobium salinisoli]